MKLLTFVKLRAADPSIIIRFSKVQVVVEEAVPLPAPLRFPRSASSWLDNASLGWRAGIPLSSCPNYLSWLLFVWRFCGSSTLSSSWMPELHLQRISCFQRSLAFQQQTRVLCKFFALQAFSMQCSLLDTNVGAHSWKRPYAKCRHSANLAPCFSFTALF